MRRSAFALGLALLAGACAPGPKSPDASFEGGGYATTATPLLLRLDAEDRAVLERAPSSQKLAVVAYGPGGLRVLAGCSAPGAYGWLGVVPERERLVFATPEELALNAPSSPEAPSDTTLRTFETVVVGRWRSGRFVATFGELSGRCAGATHVVRGFEVGFGDAGGKAPPAACAEASLDAPPAACAKLLRADLVPIGERPDDDVARALGPRRCPGAAVLSRGRCVESAGDAPFQCAPGDAAACTRQCERGDAGSCATLGWMLFMGRGVEQSWPSASARLLDACKAGQPLACGTAASLLAALPAGTAPTQEIVSLYDMACGHGDIDACVDLGALITSGERVAPNDVEGAEIFGRACAAHAPIACGDLGILYAAGRGVTRDAARARALYTEACDANEADFCVSLGRSLLGDEGGPPDPKRAVSLFLAACRSKSAQGCSMAGLAYESGDIVEQDFAEASKHYESACDLGDGFACFRLGYMTETALGRPRSFSDAADYFKKACDRGSAAGCNDLGHAYFTGDGRPKDLAFAARRFGMACDGGVGTACSNLANMYAEGLGVERDPTKAASLYEKACRAGHEPSCSKGSPAAPAK